MKFKRLLLVGLLFSVFSLGHLQSQAQIQIGVRAGLNLSGINQKNTTGDYSFNGNSNLNPGFQAGATFDIPVADEFYVQPVALFSIKGFQKSFPAASGGRTDKFVLIPYYLEVPVNLLYKPELGSGHLLLGAGPYAAYGLGGKVRQSTTITAGGNSSTTTNKRTLVFVNDHNEISADGTETAYGKPFDYGANLLVGYAFSNRLSAQLNAQLGFANLLINTNGQKPDGKRKNFGFGVSVGCIL